MNSETWERGQDVWCTFLEGVLRGRYAGERDGLHYVQLDGDDFARYVNPCQIFSDRAGAVERDSRTRAALRVYLGGAP